MNKKGIKSKENEGPELKNKILEKKGGVIIKSVPIRPLDFARKILEVEQILNNEVASKIHKEYGLALRFHL